jgi:hypothetical protein
MFKPSIIRRSKPTVELSKKLAINNSCISIELIIKAIYLDCQNYFVIVCKTLPNDIHQLCDDLLRPIPIHFCLSLNQISPM